MDIIVDFDAASLLGFFFLACAGALIVAAINVLNIAPLGRRSSIHSHADKLSHIAKGLVNSDRVYPKSDEIVNGIGYAEDKNSGKITATPKGTFSYHALLNLIYK